MRSATWRRWFAAGLVVAAGRQIDAAQQVQTPAPPAAILAGQVVDAGTGAPVANTLIGLSQRARSGPNTTPTAPNTSLVTVMTDSRGRFVIRDVPKGSFLLTLARGGVITGALRLPSGELAHNMPVIAIAVETMNGAVRLRYAGGRNATDDRGEYRIFGLPPGEYIVIAQPSGLIMGSPTGVNDALQTTPAEVSWVEAMTRRQPGAAGANITAPSRGRPVNYGTVFYPGTADSALAVPVQVGLGEERGAVDFALALVPTAPERGNCDPGEPRGAPKHAPGVPEIGREIPNPGKPARIPAGFGHGRHVTESAHGGPARVLGREPLGHLFIGELLEVEADFVVEGRVRSAPADE
jgi:hypothetical protein